MSILCLTPDCPQPWNPAGAVRCGGCGAKLILGERFQPIRLLGQGGFGRTALALDLATDPPSPCVIKQHLRPSLDSQRFYQEAEQLAALGQHPQIPQLVALLTSSQGLCLVQAYIPGPTLETAVQSQGPWTEAEVRSLLLGILPVLQFIHDRQVIHRDIKPANLVLPSPPAPPVVVDFGAAKAVTDQALRDKGTVIGSAGYAAPEQALGQATYASDLYSLGVTALYALTGQHPFDLYSALDDQWHWQPYAPHAVSLRLVQILDRLTARSLSRRYTTATEALTDLTKTSLPPLTPSPAPPSPNTPTPQSPNTPPLPPWHCPRTLDLSGQVPQALAPHPNGQIVAIAAGDQLHLWDITTDTLERPWAQRWGGLGSGHRDQVRAIAWSQEGTTLWSGSQDSTLKQWSPRQTTPLTTWDNPGWGVTTLALTATHLISGASDGHITLWPQPDGSPRVDLVRHSEAIQALGIGTDGQSLISAGQEGTLRLWQLPQGTLRHTWPLVAPVTALACHPHTPQFVLGDTQGRVRLRSLADFNQQSLLADYREAIQGIAFSPQGHYLAIGTQGGSLYLWDFEAKRPLATLHHDWGITTLAFAPAPPGTRSPLISGGGDGTLRLWLPRPPDPPGP